MLLIWISLTMGDDLPLVHRSVLEIECIDTEISNGNIVTDIYLRKYDIENIGNIVIVFFMRKNDVIWDWFT